LTHKLWICDNYFSNSKIICENGANEFHATGAEKDQ